MPELRWHGMNVSLVVSGALIYQPPLLPVRRPELPPSEVLASFAVPRADSALTIGPRAPASALADVALYDLDVASAFSLSASALPSESLAVARAERARAWLALMPSVGSGPLMDPVLRAEMDAAADDDRSAERDFDAAFRRAAPGDRSYALARAVATFCDWDGDDSALSRRLGVGERYLTRLLALPEGGYRAAYDSLALLGRAYESAMVVLAVSARLGDTARVIAHTRDLLGVLGRLSGVERAGRFQEFPYEMVAAAFLGRPRGQAWLDTLRARVLSLVRPSATEVAALQPADTLRLRRYVEQDALARIAEAALLGQRAPPVRAHVWLNTPDSNYQRLPRAHALDDGVIRFLFFPPESWPEGYTPQIAAISRLQERIAPLGQVVIVTHTQGHVGTDILDPASEVAWLTTLYRDQVHLSAVIALWAGAKEPGPYDGEVPTGSPNDSAYLALVNRFPVIVVDGHGVVRGVTRFNRRRDEVVLGRMLAYLHAEATGSTAGLERPALLIARPE